jgi:putative ABC transport system substrate-binding protein
VSLERRRRFLFTVAALLAAPCAYAQEPRARIGFLASGTPASSATNRKAFFDALRDKGWVEGKNLTVDVRYADGKLEQHDVLARELIALNPRLIYAPAQPGADAMMRLTRSIPIVFAIVPDPVGSGFAASLARPGGNATGLSTVNVTLGRKRLALLNEAFPAARRVAMLYQPELDMNRRQAAEVEVAAQSIGVEVVRISIGGPATFDAAFGKLDAMQPDAIYVMENPPLHTHRHSLIARIAKRRLPAIYGMQVFAVDGGLMAYAMSVPDQFRRAAEYVDRILRGAKPGDLPIQRPTNFDLVVNMKTAQAQGLTVSPSILLRADRVIE